MVFLGLIEYIKSCCFVIIGKELKINYWGKVKQQYLNVYGNN